MQTKHYFHSIKMVTLDRYFVRECDEDGTVHKVIVDKYNLRDVHRLIADQFTEIYGGLPARESLRTKTYVNHQGLNKVLENMTDRQWSVGDVTILSTNREERINILLDVHWIDVTNVTLESECDQSD